MTDNSSLPILTSEQAGLGERSADVHLAALHSRGSLRQSATVVVAAGGDADFSVGDLVDQPVFVGDPP